MLVTHTGREVVPLFPRFRIVAVSMKRLQIGVARIAAIPIDVIHLNPVVMLEEQPAVATPAAFGLFAPRLEKVYSRNCYDTGVLILIDLCHLRKIAIQDMRAHSNKMLRSH